MSTAVKIIECPRDAMQGIKTFIPTKNKVKYLQSLLNCGFDTIDFGSFVSPRAIPQMADTAEVLANLDLSETNSKLLSIVANVRGAQDACKHKEIQYLGYPFSISENFQMRNTHKTIAQSVETLEEILNLAEANQKEHTTPTKWQEKVHAAYSAGCKRFDGAIQGFGGCPMAKDALTGNMPTEHMLSYFTTNKVETDVNWLVFEAAYNKAKELFSSYH